MSKNNLFFGFFLVVLVAIITTIIFYQKPADPYEGITDFESCQKAGGKIMESYPRQCGLENGKFFTEQIVETECLIKNECPNGQICINNKCVK